jgi:dolichyl-phosphate-mannose--protein O-mannosyl transferase
VRDAAPAFLSLVVVAGAVYLASWSGWFASDARHAYGRDWAAGQGAAWGVPGGEALASLWHYHQQAFDFHVGLHEPHPYQSNPWSWLVLGRPVSYYYEDPTMGQSGCLVQQCSQAVLAVGNPVLWWGSLLVLPVLLALWAGRRDWRAGAVLLGVAAGYLPWFGYQGRTIYSFYAVVFVPFLVLGTTMVLGLLLGGPDASPRRRTWGAAIGGAYVLLAVLIFWWLFPVLSAQVIPYQQWRLRMFLPSWV